MKRQSGVLMHISSLNGKYGIGTLGKTAWEFVAFLSQSGFSTWQVLPVNPRGPGFSPYNSISSFAG
ncbi:MAG: 4-alpha-glucanotransferase, partial [Oscillospiraceae bacterium]|nr:4-alpha-glucanotransferase [Oscillospiraceae bacterium]